MLRRSVVARTHHGSSLAKQWLSALANPPTGRTLAHPHPHARRTFARLTCGPLGTVACADLHLLPPLPSSFLRRYLLCMSSMVAVTRRAHSSSAKGREPAPHDPAHHSDAHHHSHGDGHAHDHSHSHDHSFLSAITHTHAPGEGHADAEQIVEALKGGGDRGSRITLVGLVANVGLTASKGAAGWYMNSASLLADAGHSLSDLLGDFVTLICWKLSRRPPSELYPYGFGKFEVLGTTAISLLLTGGALGIGFHSWTLLTDALAHTATSLPAGTLHTVISGVADAAQSVPVVATEHAHSHAHSLDPNAAWFAAISIVAKEWLYRVTKRVADDERSPVLRANALHHRSDAYGSTVAFVAILGSWWFPHLPLDPIGGILVSILIFRQGWEILMTALRQLTDASVSPRTRTALLESLEPLLPDSAGRAEKLLAVQDLRAMRAGALMFVDLVAHVPRTLSVEEASSLEDQIIHALKEERKEISEVRVRFRPADR